MHYSEVEKTPARQVGQDLLFGKQGIRKKRVSDRGYMDGNRGNVFYLRALSKSV